MCVCVCTKLLHSILLNLFGLFDLLDVEKFMNKSVHCIIPKNQNAFARRCSREGVNIATKLADSVLVNVTFMIDRISEFDRAGIFDTSLVDTVFIVSRNV